MIWKPYSRTEDSIIHEGEIVYNHWYTENSFKAIAKGLKQLHSCKEIGRIWYVGKKGNISNHTTIE